MKKPILLFLCFLGCLSWARGQHLVTGKVTNASNGEALPFVTVSVVGTTSGANTEDNGTYSVTVPNGATKIQFSFVGFTTVEQDINGRNVIDIALNPEATSLDQVVVIGFGTQKKVNLTGAVNQISGDNIKDRPATTVSAVLQGKMPGVTITQNTGQPGADGGTIRIRGVGTMGNSNPLVIVDGLESRMDDINPADIANVSVLKDAAASAIYGARAANGVILVTTKRGSEGKTTINYSGYAGWQRATDLPKLLHSADYARVINRALENEQKKPIYTDEQIQKFADGSDPYNYPDTRWMDLLLNGSGFQQSHAVSVASGNEKTRYMLSLGYLDQKGLVEGSSFNRYNVRFNLDSKVSKILSVGTNMALSYSTKLEPTNPYTGEFSQFFRQVYRIPGTIVNQFADGSWGKHADGNPIAWLANSGGFRQNTPHINGSVYAELQIIEGLKLKGIAGTDYAFDDMKRHVLPVTYYDGTVQGEPYVRDYQNRYMRNTLQSILTYNKTFENDHNLVGMLGVSRETYNYRSNEGYRKNQPSPSLDQINAGSKDGQEAKGYETDMRQGSVFGRINYDYRGKYLFEANVRADGSSRFASGHRWGTFPSFSAGWRITEEEFMKNLTTISNMKLRASWGQLGNDRIDDYKYISIISLDKNYPFFNSISDGAAQVDGSNPLITWETSTELNLGVDVDLFNNSLSLSIDWYRRTTKDILVDIPVSQIYGLKAPTVNEGAMRNSGIELLVSYRNAIGTDFKYNVSANFAYNKNVVTEFPNPSKGNTIKQEGSPWNAYYGYEVLGFYQTQEQVDKMPKVAGDPVQLGDFMWKDQNNDGRIDGDDRIVIGSSQPTYTLALNLGANYKNFDFSAFFQGAFDVYRLHHGETLWGLTEFLQGQEKMLDYWTPENRNATYPNPYISRRHNMATSTFSVLKSNYLRLKSLQVGYTIPENILQYVKINKARVYFSAQNLWTIKGKLLEGIDPEVSNANYSYPNVATYTFGLDITF